MKVRDILKSKSRGPATVTRQTPLSECVIRMADLKVCDVMNPTPLCTTPDVELHELRALMIRQHQRYLPVLDQGVLMGVLSFHDVARTVFEEQAFENRLLKSYIGDWPGGDAADAKNDTFVDELDAFAAAVRGQGTPETGGEYATRSLGVIRAGIISAREGRRVQLAEVLADANA